MKQNGIPIIEQIPDYAFGTVMILPDNPEQITDFKQTISRQSARVAKFEVAVIRGDKFRGFSLEDFIALIFSDEENSIDKLAQSAIIRP